MGPPGGLAGDGGGSGPEAVWAFIVELDGPWEAGEYEIAEVIDCANDKVVMHLRRHVRGRTSGVEADFDYWAVGTSRDGKAVRSQWFAEREQAFEAATGCG